MKVKLYFEAMGNPKEFVKDFLNKLKEEISNYKDGKVIDYKIEEPIEREIEHNGKKIKLYSSFLEINIDFKDIKSLLDFVLMYSPSVIEIQEKTEFKFSSEELNEILNSISSRIIQLSLIINDLQARNQLLLQNLEKVAPRLAQKFKLSNLNFNLRK